MVNTFLLCEDFTESAKVLDKRRLGKQRVEARQIIDAIEGVTAGWVNHPATRSWKDHLPALKYYFNTIVTEWCNRGGQNNYALYTDLPSSIIKPEWCSNPKVHYSHYAQLCQKDKEEYSIENLKSRVSVETCEYLAAMPDIYHQLGYLWPYKYTNEQLLTLPPNELCEPYLLRKVCIGSYKNGAKCRNKASVGDHCKLHADGSHVVVKCAATIKTGAPCRNNAKPNSSYCGIHNKK